ncbi:MAG: protein translocase subunit SecD [Phototrophicales bacterium]
MSNHYRWLLAIIVLVAATFYIVLPNNNPPQFLRRGGDPDALRECELIVPPQDCSEYEGTFDYQLGLDLVGGLRVLMQAELPPDAFNADDLAETANNVERRINALGTTEVTVQTLGNDRILVELPGETNPERAIKTIQQTALLEFVDFSDVVGVDFSGQRILTTQQAAIQAQRRALAAENGEVLEESPLDQGAVNPVTGQPFQTIMTGDGLDAAAAIYTQGEGWVIQFDIAGDHEILDPNYSSFGEYTAANIGNPMAIVLDGVVLSAPTIRARLDTGGTISGNFTEEEAKTLALQLRSGSLSIPLRVESTEIVGATLGDESVSASIRAGIVGVIVVLTFMLVYYRIPGIAADLALLVFVLLNLALFKLVPITLTLPAITGFLISIGTAVDGNILIFERLKEEMRAGSNLNDALDAGFDRAWTSIRDSNISTIIVCGILFFFGQTPGASIVSGFAITLALGLILNLFTAVLVTRTFLYVMVDLAKNSIEKRPWLLGV